MTITTTTELSAPVNVIVQGRLLRRAKQRCIHMVGSQEGDVLMSHSGSFTVQWRRYTALAPSVTALTEKSGSISYPLRTAVQAAKTDLTQAVSKYGQFMYLTEESDLVNFTNQGAELADVFGESGGRSMNRLQRNVLEDNTTGMIYASAASADSGVADPINKNLIIRAINLLDRNAALTFTPGSTGSTNVGTTPMLPGFYGLCHSDVAADISQLNGFKGVETYAGQLATMPGEFGALTAGGISVRFLSSQDASADTDSGGAPGQNVRSTSGAAADLYTTVFLGKDAHGALSLDTDIIREVYTAGDRIPAIVMIIKARGSSGIADPLDDLGTIGYKFWHGGRVLNTDFLVGVRTAAVKYN